ncbi:MAG: hypothetical protein M1831_005559 [Alyxoria varia]|nr:MAG: hypothetical protein M1831_005559 [Alyxoria varia]
MHFSTSFIRTAILAAMANASPTPKRVDPSKFKLDFSAYGRTTDCTGPSTNVTCSAQKCIDLPHDTHSWVSFDHPKTMQISMSVYTEKGCDGRASTEHLNADGSCFNPQVMWMGEIPIRSICIACN